MWGGMMVGRFAGAFIMRSFPADKTLATFALFAMVVMIGAATLDGPTAMWALVLVGLGRPSNVILAADCSLTRGCFATSRQCLGGLDPLHLV